MIIEKRNNRKINNIKTDLERKTTKRERKINMEIMKEEKNRKRKRR